MTEEEGAVFVLGVFVLPLVLFLGVPLITHLTHSRWCSIKEHHDHRDIGTYDSRD